MLSPERPDRIHVAFDDPRLVANAGMLLPVTLAQRLGLSQLADSHLDLGMRRGGRMRETDTDPGGVGSGWGRLHKRRGRAARRRDRASAGVCGQGAIHLGTFLRSFRWGHVRQLDPGKPELLARAWDAGAGPGDSPLTIDLDSTVCETYGLGKEGAAITTTPASEAIIRCWPLPREPETC